MNYESYKSKPASEKITLAIMNASRRLVAWTLHSGSIWKKENFSVQVIDSVKSELVELVEVDSLADVVAGTFFNDRDSQTIYVQQADSGNPNASFLSMTQKLFFASGPISLPYDLNTGEDVFFEPMVFSTSSFGVEIDTVNQQNEAIEGKGTLTLRNDSSFWPANFDKLYFENQVVEIYSYSRELDPSEAKLLFRGKVEAKTYSSDRITFTLKDLMANLKDTISLSTIESLNARNDANLDQAFQRMIFGRNFGFRPVNIDAVQNGFYPLTGTFSVTNSSATFTGASTEFLTQVSPDDVLLISGVEYTVASVASDTSLTLTEVYEGVTASGLSVEIRPDQPKRWMNRIWKIAGHPLCEPTTTITAGSSTSRLFMDSTQDIYPGDEIYIGTLGSGELVTVDEVLNSTQLTLSTSLSSNPGIGTAVRRPAIQQLKINETELRYYRDYTLDASTATLTLLDTAEKNAGKVKESTQSATFTNGSRTVTGTGTFFKTLLKPGYVIKPKGTADFFEVLSVDSDTSLTLRSAPSATNTAAIQFKELIFDPQESVLSCEVLGRTDTNLSSGRLLKTAPEIIKTLLTDAGLLAEIDVDSFEDGLDLSPEEVAFVLPATYQDKKLPTYREAINSINKSVFGVLYQNQEFKFAFDVLRPQSANASVLNLDESDCLNFAISSTNKNMAKNVTVRFALREFDFTNGGEAFQSTQTESEISRYIFNTGKVKTIDSVLVNEADAQRLSNRWAFLLENSTNQIEIQTKLQAIDLEIGSVIKLSHRKLYERFQGVGKSKVLLVERIEKSAQGVIVSAVDLSNAFNRVAFISNADSSFANSDDDTRMNSGFFTDEFGLIDNEEDSFGTNLIW